MSNRDRINLSGTLFKEFIHYAWSTQALPRVVETRAALDLFGPTFVAEWDELLHAKLGLLSSAPDDDALFEATAQHRYRAFVGEGGGATSLWEHVEAQCLLGPPTFAESLTSQMQGRETATEIPKDQRYVGRPSLAELFAAARTDRTRRDARIVDAVDRHGYSQKAVADWLGLHYSTVSRLVNQREA